MSNDNPKIKLQYGTIQSGVYKKTVSGSRHFLKKPPSIALEVTDLDGVRQHNGKTIEITDRESGKVYSVDFDHFCRHASEPFNRGWGWQRFLTFSHWTVTQGKRKNTPLPIADQTPAHGYVTTATNEVTEPEATQLSFMAEVVS